MIKADLHVHTDISDSSYNIDEVLKLAKERGLTHIAITNHDTTRGLEEAIKKGKEYGIVVIPGVEISAYDYKRNRKVHVIGLNVDILNDNIDKLCFDLLKNRDENTKKQIDIIRSMGYDITEDEVGKYAKNSRIFYKQHIMKVLMDKGYTESIYSDLYTKIFNKNSPCNLNIKYIDVYDALDVLNKNGAISIIAHPGQFNSYDLIEELIQYGICGIEKYHPSHRIEDEERVEKIAKKYNLIKSGGSDFHGDYAKKNCMGKFLAPKEDIYKILNN